MSPPTPGASARGSVVALAVVLVVHLAVSARTIAPASLLTADPFYADDYALHFGRAATVASALPRTGRLWTYDPTLMAGYPLGATVFDLDNVGTAIALAALGPLGIEPPAAFKLLVALCLALAPLAIWASTRLLGAPSVEALTAAAAATVVAASAITFRLGMFANFAAGYLAVLVVALAACHLARPRRGSFVTLVAVATAGLLLHVFLAILVLVPCAVLVLGHGLRAPRRAALQSAAIVLALLAVNAVWLGPFLRFAPVLGWDYPHHFFQTGRLAGAWRTLTVLSGWHLTLLAFAGIGFTLSARRLGRPLALAYGSWVVVLLFAALQGSRVPFLGRFEPAHLVLPLAFVLCPLAGIGVVAVLRTLRLPGAALLAAPLVFAPHLCVTLHATAALPAIAASLPPGGEALVGWLRAHTDRSARVLVEDRLHLERPRLDANVPDHPWF
ncbi:MAG TPA: hypothetical protein VE997_06360, partial [Candidatus Limnocylindria bacterium]|nr:hypothetical protein [Candidatus Limnocylindria bacterium]